MVGIHALIGKALRRDGLAVGIVILGVDVVFLRILHDLHKSPDKQKHQKDDGQAIGRKRMRSIRITGFARKPDKTVKFPTGVKFFTDQKSAGYYCDKFENMTQSVKKQHTISFVGAVPFRWEKFFDFHEKPHQAGERKDFPLLFYFGTELAIFQDRGSVEIPSFFRR